MKKLQIVLLGAMIGFGLGFSCPQQNAAAAPLDPAQVPINRETVSSQQELVRRSDVILYGRIGGKAESHPTGRREGAYRVVHYVQNIRVKDVWKGHTAGTVRLLVSGVEPLPEADHPLNRTYTGPLESGEYVCFLRKVPGTEYYTLTGIWKGLYPVFEGKSIALLANGGFASFDRLSISQFKANVKGLSSP